MDSISKMRRADLVALALRLNLITVRWYGLEPSFMIRRRIRRFLAAL